MGPSCIWTYLKQTEEISLRHARRPKPITFSLFNKLIQSLSFFGSFSLSLSYHIDDYHCENGVYQDLYDLALAVRLSAYAPFLSRLRKNQNHVSGQDIADYMQVTMFDFICSFLICFSTIILYFLDRVNGMLIYSVRTVKRRKLSE